MAIRTDELTTPARLRVLGLERGTETAIHILPDGTGLTFRVWDERSEAAARGLADLGVKPGDRVLLPVTADWLSYAVAYVATHKAGATAVPVLASHGEEHLRWACDRSAAVGVISDHPVGEVRGWSIPVSGLESGGQSPLNVTTRAGDEAEIIFTSGTTGRPKGVVATHENIMYAIRGAAHGRPKRVMHAIPPATNAGQGLLLQPLSNTPHTVMVLPRFRAEEFLEAIEKWRPTDIVLVPAMALALLRAQEAAPRDLTSVRMVRTMSAPITPASLERLQSMFPNAVTVNMYASTESWPARVRTRFDRTRPASVGRPEGASRVRIVDACGSELPAGVTGEVQLRAGGAAPRRYLDDPEASARVFLPDGWVRTGDLGSLDADGYLYLSDREDDVVISGGLNVSTLEVAAVLEAHPQVIEAAALGMPHDVLQQYVAAVVRATPGLDLAALYEYARQRLGPAKAPRRIVIVDDLPRTPMGKVIKNSLPAIVLDRAELDSRPGPGTGADEQIARIWAEVLDRPVAPASDFLELGGTSLEAAEITARMRRELGRLAREEDLYRAGTLAEYARIMAAAKPLDAPSDMRITRVARRSG